MLYICSLKDSKLIGNCYGNYLLPLGRKSNTQRRVLRDYFAWSTQSVVGENVFVFFVTKLHYEYTEVYEN